MQDTEWHRVTCFNGLAGAIEQYAQKGMKLLVRGRLHYSKWTDSGGVERYGAEIIADSVDFLTRAKSEPSESDAAPPAADPDDDIPF